MKYAGFNLVLMYLIPSNIPELSFNIMISAHAL